jgi:hypothetical protein
MQTADNTGNVCKVVTRLNNDCCRGNVTMCFLCIVVDLRVAINSTKPLHGGNAKVAPLYPVVSSVIFLILGTFSRGFFMEYSHVTVNQSVSRVVTVTAPDM